MKKFVAKVEIPGKDPRCICDAVIYKGKLAQLCKKGVGEPHTVGGMFNGEGDVWEEYDSYVDTYRPIFNSSLLKECGIEIQDVQKILDKDQMLAFEDKRLLNCMLTLGDNANGYKVIDQTAVEEQAQAEYKQKEAEAYRNKTHIIKFHSGVFGYTISEKLPDYVWALVKPFGTFHKGDEEDIEWADDMGIEVHPLALYGWFYTEQAMAALLESGYKVYYLGIEIHSIDDLPAVEATTKAKNEAYRNAVTLFNDIKNELRQDFRNLFVSGEYMSESDCNKIRDLPEILFENLDITGANIYGGGFWMHADDKFLYLVQNNGMDGDDWSRNNYGTGGAGAICMRAPLTNSIASLLKRACDFEKKSIEDYISKD